MFNNTKQNAVNPKWKLKLHEEVQQSFYWGVLTKFAATVFLAFLPSIPSSVKNWSLSDSRCYFLSVLHPWNMIFFCLLEGGFNLSILLLYKPIHKERLYIYCLLFNKHPYLELVCAFYLMLCCIRQLTKNLIFL